MINLKIRHWVVLAIAAFLIIHVAIPTIYNVVKQNTAQNVAAVAQPMTEQVVVGHVGMHPIYEDDGYISCDADEPICDLPIPAEAGDQEIADMDPMQAAIYRALFQLRMEEMSE